MAEFSPFVHLPGYFDPHPFAAFKRCVCMCSSASVEIRWYRKWQPETDVWVWPLFGTSFCYSNWKLKGILHCPCRETLFLKGHQRQRIFVDS